MPRIKSKYKHIKVYRPSGTAYAQGICEWPLKTTTPFPIVTSWTIAYATDLAMRAFIAEFGYLPEHKHLVVEVSCTRAGAYATVYDLKEV